MQGGRLDRRRRRARKISRRQFLLRGAVAAALLGTKPTAPAATGPVQPLANTPFQHGVASGDPASDSVVLWTRVTVPAVTAVTVHYSVALDPAMTCEVASGTVGVNGDTDFTVKLEANGLAPATTYYYRFAIGGQRSPIGRTRTLPSGEVAHLRIGVVSCSSMKRAIGLPATPPVSRAKSAVFALLSPRTRRGTSMYPGRRSSAAVSCFGVVRSAMDD